jgi:hypothetical protein
MKLTELIIDDYDESEVIDAIENWKEQKHPNSQVPIILSPHYAKNFKIADANEIYRCLTITDSDKIHNVKASNRIIVYTESINCAHGFHYALDSTLDYIIIKKEFRPNDLVLNFSAFTGWMRQLNDNEQELWMRPTTYYRTFDESEIVYDSRKIR